MRLVSFEQAGRRGVGLCVGKTLGPDDRFVDLATDAVVEALGFGVTDMVALLGRGLDALRPLDPAKMPASALLRLRDVRVLPPVPNPGKILGAARNFHDFLRQLKLPVPAEPVWFPKLPNTLAGPADPIRIPPGVADVTYEGEVALVIGRRASRVSREHAREHVAGYMLLNDVTGGELLKRDGGNLFRAKNVDTFCPCGPFLVSAEEIADPHALRIRLEVDGKVLQDGSTEQMVFDMDQLLSHISQTITLEPGDIIATGTPGGTAVCHSPPAFLRGGQTVTVAVDGLGALVNPVVST